MPTSARFLFAEVIRDPVESERHPTALGLPFGKRCRSCSPRTRACKAGWGGDCRGRFPKSRIRETFGVRVLLCQPSRPGKPDRRARKPGHPKGSSEASSSFSLRRGGTASGCTRHGVGRSPGWGRCPTPIPAPPSIPLRQNRARPRGDGVHACRVNIIETGVVFVIHRHVPGDGRRILGKVQRLLLMVTSKTFTMPGTGNGARSISTCLNVEPGSAFEGQVNRRKYCMRGLQCPGWGNEERPCMPVVGVKWER